MKGTVDTYTQYELTVNLGKLPKAGRLEHVDDDFPWVQQQVLKAIECDGHGLAQIERLLHSPGMDKLFKRRVLVVRWVHNRFIRPSILGLDEYEVKANGLTCAMPRSSRLGCA